MFFFILLRKAKLHLDEVSHSLFASLVYLCLSVSCLLRHKEKVNLSKRPTRRTKVFSIQFAAQPLTAAFLLITFFCRSSFGVHKCKRPFKLASCRLNDFFAFVVFEERHNFVPNVTAIVFYHESFTFSRCLFSDQMLVVISQITSV